MKQGLEDIDSLIVSTAMERSIEEGNVFIVGEDTDLLVLLTFYVAVFEEPISNVFLIKPGTRKLSFTVGAIAGCLKTGGSMTCFSMPFTGCDTTSSFFRQDKIKLVKKFMADQSLFHQASIFLDPIETPDKIAEAGVHFIKTLYTGGSSRSLNQVMFDVFRRSLSKKNSDLAFLPPAEAAARQYSFRAYLKV